MYCLHGCILISLWYSYPTLEAPSVDEHPLPVIPDSLRERIDQWLTVNTLPELYNPLQASLVCEDPRPRVGLLFWPVLGLCRFAYGLYVVDGYTLGLLRQDITAISTAVGSFTDTNTWNCPLYALYRDDPDTPELTQETDEGGGNTGPAVPANIAAPLFLIACRPLNRLLSSSDDPLNTDPTGIDDLFLITLVDWRYLLVTQSFYGYADQIPDPTGASFVWSSLAATLLGNTTAYDPPVEETWQFDPIPTSYFLPGSRWYALFQAGVATSYLADDMLACVQSRYVSIPNYYGGPGTFTGPGLKAIPTDVTEPNNADFPYQWIARPTTSNLQGLVNWHEEQVAGGRQFSGGYVEQTEATQGVPTVITGAVQATDSFTGAFVYGVYTQTGVLTSPGLEALFDSHLSAWFDISPTATTAQSETALQQWAADFYAWQQVPLDVTYAGFPSFENLYPYHCGWIDSIEIYHSDKTGYTKFNAARPNWVTDISKCAWICPGDGPVQTTIVQAVCPSTCNISSEACASYILLPPGVMTSGEPFGISGSPMPSLSQCLANPGFNLDCPVGSTYNCVGGAGCSEVLGCGGEYATLTECQNSCQTYNCITSEGCVAAGTSGTYGSLSSCISACISPPPPPTMYDCVSGSCIATLSGTYSSLSACTAACVSPPVTYNCTGTGCTAVYDGTGMYSTLSACTTACTSTYGCVDGACTLGAGSSTLSDCMATCGESPPPPPPPPPTWNCNGITGSCTEVFDGSGEYSTLDDCTADCSDATWGCLDGICENGTGSMTLAACTAVCGNTYGCVDHVCVEGAGSMTPSACAEICEVAPPPPTPHVVPARIALDCLYKGGERMIGNKIYSECTHPDKPNGAEVCRCTNSCNPKCVGYNGTQPDVVKRLQIDGFNGSVFAWKGEDYVVYRVGYTNARIWLSKTDGSLRRRLILPSLDAKYAQEDPRFVVLSGEPHIFFTGVAVDRSFGVVAAKLNDDLTVAHVYTPDFPARLAQEKNWMPFECEGKAYLVYSILPHRILALDVENECCSEAYNTKFQFNTQPFGDLRGGTPPVRVGDEYISFFHGRRVKGNKLYYNVGAYAFAAHAPFAVTRITREPIWTPDASTDVPAPHARSVVFPCGAVKTANGWTVSSGVQDRWLDVGTFHDSVIDEALIDVGHL